MFTVNLNQPIVGLNGQVLTLSAEPATYLNFATTALMSANEGEVLSLEDKVLRTELAERLAQGEVTLSFHEAALVVSAVNKITTSPLIVSRFVKLLSNKV